jgi:hypothetical protein
LFARTKKGRAPNRGNAALDNADRLPHARSVDDSSARITMTILEEEQQGLLGRLVPLVRPMQALEEVLDLLLSKSAMPFVENQINAVRRRRPSSRAFAMVNSVIEDTKRYWKSSFCSMEDDVALRTF